MLYLCQEDGSKVLLMLVMRGCTPRVPVATKESDRDWWQGPSPDMALAQGESEHFLGLSGAELRRLCRQRETSALRPGSAAQAFQAAPHSLPSAARAGLCHGAACAAHCCLLATLTGLRRILFGFFLEYGRNTPGNGCASRVHLGASARRAEPAAQHNSLAPAPRRPAQIWASWLGSHWKNGSTGSSGRLLWLGWAGSAWVGGGEVGRAGRDCVLGMWTVESPWSCPIALGL